MQHTIEVCCILYKGIGEMKKSLIIVESIPNIVTAIAIRNEMYSEEAFDLLITNGNTKIIDIKNGRKLEGIFDNVYYADVFANNNIIKKCIGIISLKAVLKLYLMDNKTLCKDYTDLFFWNPSELFYIVSSYLGKNVRYHVYGDQLSAFTMDSPDEDITEYCFYKRGLFNNAFKLRYKPKRVDSIDFDFYMFRPDLSCCTRKHSVVEIPSTCFDNSVFISMISDIYDYDKSFSIKQDYIYFGNVAGEEKDYKSTFEVLKKLIEIVPREELIVKPHPRMGKEYYKDYDVDIVDKVFPWDLYCLNNDISNKVFITDVSSAVFIPAFVYGKRFTVIWLRNVIKGNKIFEKEWDSLICNLEACGCKSIEINSIDEIRVAIENIRQGRI